MRRIELSIATAVAALAQVGACSLFVDTSSLSSGSNDAGNDAESASDTSASDSSGGSDSSSSDGSAPTISTLVQQRGTSGSNTNTLTISLPTPTKPGNSLLLLVASSTDDPTSISGGATWQQSARSGAHIATSMWLGASLSAGDVTVSWSDTQVTGAVLLTEWSGQLTKQIDMENQNSGTDISTDFLTPGQPSLAIAVCGMHNHSVTSPTGGFTAIDSVARDDLQLLVADRNVNTSFGTSWTAVEADGWDTLLVSFTAN